MIRLLTQKHYSNSMVENRLEGSQGGCEKALDGLDTTSSIQRMLSKYLRNERTPDSFSWMRPLCLSFAISLQSTTSSSIFLMLL